MKATIDKDGILLVTAENELECYALSRWIDESFDENNGFIANAIVVDPMNNEF